MNTNSKCTYWGSAPTPFSAHTTEAVMCQSCKELSVVGIRCNAHRVESTSTRLIREATAQGFTLTGSVTDQALQAERLLNAKPVVLS